MPGTAPDCRCRCRSSPVRRTRRVPHAPAGVDVGVPPQVFGRGVEVPQLLAAGGFQRPQDADATGAVELAVVARHRRDVCDAVVVAGRHVDALAGVAHQFDRPQLRAGFLVQCERRCGRGPVHAPSSHGEAVGSLVGGFIVFRPQHLPRLQIDRLHVGFQVLRVDHAIADNRRGGVGAVQAFGGERHVPRDAELFHRRGVDRPAREAGVGEVAVGRAGAVERVCRPRGAPARAEGDAHERQ